MSANPTVLILDDEESVLELTALCVRDRGYSTTACTSAQSALERFKQMEGALDLLIADVTLPDGSGIEVGARLQELTPKLKLLFMSGYSQDEWTQSDRDFVKNLLPGSFRTLRKPFSARELLANARELIGTPAKDEGIRPPRLTPEEE